MFVDASHGWQACVCCHSKDTCGQLTDRLLLPFSRTYSLMQSNGLMQRLCEWWPAVLLVYAKLLASYVQKHCTGHLQERVVGAAIMLRRGLALTLSQQCECWLLALQGLVNSVCQVVPYCTCVQ
jgi:hypothetical protein